jgi:hypothetical protein
MKYRSSNTCSRSGGTIIPTLGAHGNDSDFGVAGASADPPVTSKHSAPCHSSGSPFCFKRRKRDQHVVETGITEDDVVVWRCLACGTEGRISNWQGTFWDLS